MHGYDSVKDWYFHARQQGGKLDAGTLEVEYRQQLQAWETAAETAEKAEEERVDVVESPSSPSSSRVLAPALLFGDVTPLAWRRVDRHCELREVLRSTLLTKWAESTSGPEAAMPHLLGTGDAEIRKSLKAAQQKCPETRALAEEQARWLTATKKDGTKGLEKACEDYRLHPQDGIVERQVALHKTSIWVPELPAGLLPVEFQTEHSDTKMLTWRRWAFELAHCTFLNPHRAAGPTWQTLKRMGHWKE